MWGVVVMFGFGGPKIEENNHKVTTKLPQHYHNIVPQTPQLLLSFSCFCCVFGFGGAKLEKKCLLQRMWFLRGSLCGSVLQTTLWEKCFEETLMRAHWEALLRILKKHILLRTNHFRSDVCRERPFDTWWFDDVSLRAPLWKRILLWNKLNLHDLFWERLVEKHLESSPIKHVCYNKIPFEWTFWFRIHLERPSLRNL